MSAAADQLRGFFKRLAQLETQGESSFLANVEKVLLERDALLAASKNGLEWLYVGDAEEAANVLRAVVLKADPK